MSTDPIKQAAANHYSCQLVYFIVLSFVLYYLYLYQNPLYNSIFSIFLYLILISINLYLFLTTGTTPGYIPPLPQDQTLISPSITPVQTCQLCSTSKPLRSKHCYDCGRCVYKFDHHCTWIGSCVGEFNHGKFWFFCFMQTIQAVITLWIVHHSNIDQFYKAIGNYEYETKEQQYNGAYGAIMIMIMMMVFYTLFVGGMLLFHTYLVVMNTTTYESTKFTKIPYMKKGLYPFYEGMVKNLGYVFCHGGKEGIEWKVEGEDVILNIKDEVIEI